MSKHGMRRMRVGVDARSALSKNPRGEGKSLLRLYSEISVMRPEWDVVFYGYPGAPPADIENVRISEFDIPGFRFNLWENIALPIHALLDKVDILHCAGSSAPRYIHGTPIILTVHDLIPLVFAEGICDRKVSQFKNQIRYGLSKAEAIIAVSENTKSDIIKIFGTPAEKITVVYWGCDCCEHTTGAHKKMTQVRPVDLGLPERYIMAFGGASPRKNTERIISAFATTSHALTDMHLVLIGVNDPAIRSRFLSLAKKLNIGHRIVIMNFIDDDTLNTVYKHAQCLLYPSLYEGFGLPVLEAMARGVPVVASNSSSIPEVTGDAALLVNPECENDIVDALSSIFADEWMRENLAARGLERSRLFSWRKTAMETIRILENSAL